MNMSIHLKELGRSIMNENYSKDPLVSVILPTYNRANLIKRAINSVLNQTYKNLELIIIDDGSTDETEDIIKGMKDKRIRYFKYVQNRGVSYARNKGILLAKGSLIAFQDSDDIWLKDKLERQIQIMINTTPDVGVVYTGFWQIYDANRIYIPSKEIKSREGYILKNLINGNFVGTPTMLVKRDCFNRVGLFDESLPRLNDWELCIRLAQHYKFLLIDEPLVIAHISKDSISRDDKKLITALDIILNKHYDLFFKDKYALSQHLNRLSDLLITEGSHIKGKKTKIKSLLLRYLEDKRSLGHFYINLSYDLENNKKFIESKENIIKSLLIYHPNLKYIIYVLILLFTNHRIHKKIISFYKATINKLRSFII